MQQLGKPEKATNDELIIDSPETGLKLLDYLLILIILIGILISADQYNSLKTFSDINKLDWNRILEAGEDLYDVDGENYYHLTTNDKLRLLMDVVLQSESKRAEHFIRFLAFQNLFKPVLNSNPAADEYIFVATRLESLTTKPGKDLVNITIHGESRLLISFPPQAQPDQPVTVKINDSEISYQENYEVLLTLLGVTDRDAISTGYSTTDILEGANTKLEIHVTNSYGYEGYETENYLGVQSMNGESRFIASKRVRGDGKVVYHFLFQLTPTSRNIHGNSLSEVLQSVPEDKRIWVDDILAVFSELDPGDSSEP